MKLQIKQISQNIQVNIKWMPISIKYNRELIFAGNEEPTTVRNTRSSVKRKRSKKIPIRQPKVILTDLIHTIGKDKLIEYRSISSKTPLNRNNKYGYTG